MVGTGGLAPHVIESHAAVRPNQVSASLGTATGGGRDGCRGFADRPTRSSGERSSRRGALGDIISCATLAETPIVHGGLLPSGQHLDLIGSFTPAMPRSGR